MMVSGLELGGGELQMRGESGGHLASSIRAFYFFILILIIVGFSAKISAS
jgi:hypothetical protein